MKSQNIYINAGVEINNCPEGYAYSTSVSDCEAAINETFDSSCPDRREKEERRRKDGCMVIWVFVAHVVLYK